MVQLFVGECQLHLLYSFRRCPYAIRARMALSYAGISVGIREVKLSNKPMELINASKKATVPVLVLDSGEIIEESIDIMHWALAQSDPEHWLRADLQEKVDDLIYKNDHEFKPLLDSYKYPQSAPVNDPVLYRQQALSFLSALNALLSTSSYFLSDKPSMADVAIFPFVRQFCMVDKDWFMQSSLDKLIAWLTFFLDSPLFMRVMKKYPPWKAGEQEPLLEL